MLKQSVLLSTTVLSFTEKREEGESQSTSVFNFAVPFLERARNWNWNCLAFQIRPAAKHPEQIPAPVLIQSLRFFGHSLLLALS